MLAEMSRKLSSPRPCVEGSVRALRGTQAKMACAHGARPGTAVGLYDSEASAVAGGGEKGEGTFNTQKYYTTTIRGLHCRLFNSILYS